MDKSTYYQTSIAHPHPASLKKKLPTAVSFVVVPLQCIWVLSQLVLKH